MKQTPCDSSSCFQSLTDKHVVFVELEQKATFKNYSYYKLNLLTVLLMLKVSKFSVVHSCHETYLSTNMKLEHVQ